MKRMLAMISLCALVVAACPRNPASPPQDKPKPAGAAAAPTNRIDVPEAVRKNLGITFAEVARRSVQRTRRFSGAFEAPPHARQEYRAPFAGFVRALPRELAKVEAQAPLVRLESPELLMLHRQAVEAHAELARARIEKVTAEARFNEANALVHAGDASLAAQQERISAHAKHERAAHAVHDRLRERLEQIEALASKVGGHATERSEALTRLAESELELARLGEELAELHLRLAEAEARVAALRAAVPVKQAEHEAALATVDIREHVAEQTSALLARINGASDNSPSDSIELRADRPGVVVSVMASEGQWVEAGALLVSTLDRSELRFRAHALQGDLAELREGMTVRIPGLVVSDPGITSKLMIAPVADAEQRSIDLFCAVSPPAWARPGLRHVLEVELDEGGEELAIPARALVQDGMDTVFFLRDAGNPDRVIRTVADLGVSDGVWTEVLSGLRPTDQVVIEGVYELKLTGQGKAPAGGHFHADGTFHAGAHGEGEE